MSKPFPHNIPEKHLIDRVLGGDNQAFAIIIQQTEGLVAQMVFKMIQRSDDRKDLVQDIYLKVYKNLSTFKYQSRLSTWIGQITYNTCISYLRTKKMLLPGYDNAGDESDHSSPNDPVATEQSDEPIFQKQRLALLQAAMERLSPIHRTLITLYHQEEMSYQEIGMITSLPEGTVKSYLFRARKSLKENLLLNYKKEEL